VAVLVFALEVAQAEAGGTGMSRLFYRRDINLLRSSTETWFIFLVSVVLLCLETGRVERMSAYRVTIYRDDSTTTVVYDNVKHVFWTASNTVLVIAKYNDDGSHYYIHWPREQVCWFKVEKGA